MGDTVSVFGMQLVGLAIPIMAVQVLGANAFEMGVLVTLEMLAFLLIGLPAGAWVDRWRKKRIIVLGDLTRGALLLTLPLAWGLDLLSLWQLYAVAFATGCITVFFDIANQSYLPEIVESDQIGEGNAKLQASQQTASVVGPALAAVLIRWIGSPLTIAVTSVCMAASSLFVSRVRHEEQQPPREDRRPLAQEISQGLQFVVKHPLLVRITACTGLSNFTSGLVEALFVLFVLRDLGLNETTLGLIFSAAAVGGLLGAVSATRVARWVGEGRAIPLSALLIPAAAVTTPLAAVLPAVPTLIVGGFLSSWSVVVYNITQVSFRQRLCPKPLLGRMNASIRFMVWGPIPIGAFLGGVLGQQWGIVPTLWLAVGIAGLAALPVLISPLIGMRDLPRELDALAGAEVKDSADGAVPAAGGGSNPTTPWTAPQD
jgi:MFS family permease